MTKSRIVVALCLATLVSACQAPFGAMSFQTGSSAAAYRCAGGVTLTLDRQGAMMNVRDSRGVEASIPASPAGQSSRYAQGIYALILEDREATWFVSGKKPAVCRR